MAILEIRGLVKQFDGRNVLAGVDMALDAGEVKVIMGPSGCGKTTLTMCLTHLTAADGGSIRFHGREVPRGGAGLRRVRRKVAYVFQHFALYRHLTVLDNVTLALRKLDGMAEASARASGMAELDRFGMAAHADKFPAQLSGGQKQRVALARALVTAPDVLILDEPTSALDPLMTREVAGIIRSLSDRRVAILCVTHDVALAEQVAGQVIYLDQGRVKAVGSARQLADEHADPEVREFFGRRHVAK